MTCSECQGELDPCEACSKEIPPCPKCGYEAQCPGCNTGYVPTATFCLCDGRYLCGWCEKPWRVR